VSTSAVETKRREENLELLIPEVQQETRRRRLRLSARIVAVLSVAAALAISLLLLSEGSGTRTGPRNDVGPPVGGAGLGAAISISKMPTLEVYDYSGPTKWYPSPVYFRRVGASSPPQALASGMWASETPPAGPSTDLAVFGSGNTPETTIYSIGNHTISSRLRMHSNGQGTVLLATRNDVYVQRASASPISEISIRTGRLVHLFNVPQIPFTPPPGYKGLYVGNTSQGWIESLVLERGRLYAFQFNSYTASVDDLSNGTHRLLHGYGQLGGGVLAANGDLYVMAWRSEPRTSFHLLRINPTNLSVVSTAHTGVLATSVANFQMQALPGGGLLAFVAQLRVSRPNVAVNAYLWKLNRSGLERRDLPANIGLDMRAFANGVYLFGGPGRNIVARLNVSNLTLTRNVPTLDTPNGTYLFALT